MAFDLAWRRPDALAPLLIVDIPEITRTGDLGPQSRNTKVAWRQTVLGIGIDVLDHIEPGQPLRNAQLWRLEAQQRISHFTGLGLSDIPAHREHFLRSQQTRRHSSNAATLSAAYRLLAKCEGPEAVECRHLFRSLLVNLLSVHAPVYGEIGLRLNLCSIVLPRNRCRALLLGTALLIQATIRHSCEGSFNGRSDLELSIKGTDEYALSLRLKARPANLLGSAEFGLATRLFGVLQAELSCRQEQENKMRIALSFSREAR